MLSKLSKAFISKAHLIISKQYFLHQKFITFLHLILEMLLPFVNGRKQSQLRPFEF